jgi:hypothetical protein
MRQPRSILSKPIKLKIAVIKMITATPACYVRIIFFPAGRFLTMRGCFFLSPFPYFAARFLAAVILPPLLFFAILFHRL